MCNIGLTSRIHNEPLQINRKKSVTLKETKRTKDIYKQFTEEETQRANNHCYMENSK